MPSAPPATVAPIPDGWAEQPVGPSSIALHLPPDWMTFGPDEIDDPTTRQKVEDRFPGAEGLFDAVASQGERVELQFLGVDPSNRGGPAIPAAITVVAVEPRVPAVGLDLGAGLVLDGLDEALDIETQPTRDRITTPVGPGVRFSFEHRVTDDGGGPGFRALLEGALVTSDEASFLVLRNADARVDDPLTPSLEEVLATLRDLP